MVVSLLIVFVVLLALFVPSIVASSRRKRLREDEVLYSVWRDWNGDGSVFQLSDVSSWPLADTDEPSPEPEHGVVVIHQSGRPVPL